MRLLFAFFLAGLAAVPVVRGQQTVDGIETVVGDAFITHWQVQQLTVDFGRRLYAQNSNQPSSFYQTQISLYREDTLKGMVSRQLVLQDFKRLQKENHANIPDNVIDEAIRSRIRDPRFGGDRSAFLKELQAEGMTMEQYRAQVRDDIIIEAMQGQYLHDPIISPHKMETYYRDHQDEFKVEERVRLQRLFLKKPADDTTNTTRERAEEIRQLYKPGTTFASLVKSYSEAAPDEGDWRELSSLGEVFREAIAKLKPGECSPPLETSQGVFLLELVERDPAHVAPLADVRAKVERDLAVQERTRESEKWMSRLRARTFVVFVE